VRYGYYPGCALEHSRQPYQISTLAVAAELEVGLDAIEDWNCCGATEYMALNRTAAYALVGRNLALAQRQFGGNVGGPTTLVAACSACFLNLAKTDHYLAEYPEVRGKVDEALRAGGLSYTPHSVRSRHLLDVFVSDVGLEAVRRHVKKPLRDLRVAPYYGCLTTRPDLPGRAPEDFEYPMQLDDLLSALGAEVIDYPLKTHCCGGHMTQISAETAYSLLYRLLRSAAEYRADVIAVTCPMCQLNLDGYQGQVNRTYKADFDIPILYFTQLMGVAFELDPESLGLGRELVSSEKALAKVGVATPHPPPEAPARPTARKKGDKALPMPRRLRGSGRKPRAKQ
jgi:heterodisulfide reductase subunit B